MDAFEIFDWNVSHIRETADRQSYLNQNHKSELLS